MKKFDKNQIREFIKENDLKTADDVQNALKELFADTLQEMLEAELDDSLGYPKNGKLPIPLESITNSGSCRSPIPLGNRSPIPVDADH